MYPAARRRDSWSLFRHCFTVTLGVLVGKALGDTITCVIVIIFLRAYRLLYLLHVSVVIAYPLKYGFTFQW